MEFDFVNGGSLASFYRQATPGTTYWRGYIPMKALPGQVIALQPNSLFENEDGLGMTHSDGALIWQFLGDDSRSRIALQMQKQGKLTLMEVDDNYLRFAPPLYGKHGAWTKTHAEAMANGTGYSVEMHRKVVPQMDGIICATEHLADEYSRWNDNVFVCRNSIDPTDWDLPPREDSEALRIGYYGSPSHIRDWPKVKKAMKWAAKQGDVEVLLVGFSPPGYSGSKLPWEDNLYAARRNLVNLDVGIAPITRNPWADGKSDIKAMEYAMAGVMPILEDAPCYSPWKDDISWPWMASSDKEWSDMIHTVVENRDSVKEMAATAKSYVMEHRTIDKEIHKWREAIGAE